MGSPFLRRALDDPNSRAGKMALVGSGFLLGRDKSANRCTHTDRQGQQHTLSQPANEGNQNRTTKRGEIRRVREIRNVEHKKASFFFPLSLSYFLLANKKRKTKKEVGGDERGEKNATLLGKKRKN